MGSRVSFKSGLVIRSGIRVSARNSVTPRWRRVPHAASSGVAGRNRRIDPSRQLHGQRSSPDNAPRRCLAIFNHIHIYKSFIFQVKTLTDTTNYDHLSREILAIFLKKQLLLRKRFPRRYVCWRGAVKSVFFTTFIKIFIFTKDERAKEARNYQLITINLKYKQHLN